ncbi:MAG: formamidopyrimidine-DNA glycosylase [Gemmatimonadota bacterium]|uniref:Fpg/Nei family DNA glycosylase n=1 Tax=Candidatus Palauibacter scopulicola TaxID=3056741 RepID=UPI002396546E|nr:DNA-formamidopyrimidine glycosylase family protein [Candidatus Palauibacter scopulicola]MDE2661989.1 formamidopyrimidine-DNA glycosylase [Candidatus Palauibacter scopulicola]
MPELPDITVYLEGLETRVLGRTLERVRLGSPFLLRSVDPPLTEAHGRRVVALRRLGKRIAIGLALPEDREDEPELWLVLHLMIAGRLRWRDPGVKIPRRLGLAAFDFAEGSLLLTEAGTKKRASLHVVKGAEALARHDPGGIDPLTADPAAFRETLTARNHTLKRALTDPRLFSGIGNAYSDEILHRAKLSPIKWTSRLGDEEIDRLQDAVRQTLARWTRRLRDELAGEFPEKVTAFHAGMAVHGKYGEPCPDCAAPVQRIRYADNETNYCAACQTGGKVVADRALSRLLGKDWPRSLEALEALRSGGESTAE